MINKLSKYQDYIVVLLLALAAAAVYLPSINAPFIFDDHHMIVENAFIKNPNYFSMFLKGYVTSYPIPHGMCRPLLMLTFAFNYANGRLNPIGYHIINTIFHFVNAILLFYLLKTLKEDIPSGIALFISLIFVVHPINTEAVSYISSRSDLMVTLFIIGGFILYLKRRYLFSISCYALALLTKETALIYPILIGGYFLLYTPQRVKQILKDKRFIIFVFSIIAITIGYFLYKNIYFGGISTGKLRPLSFNILLQSWVTFFYLRLFLWPSNLNFLHSSPYINSIFQLNTALPFTGIVILITMIFILRIRHRLLSLGIFLYLTGLVPKFYAALKVPAMEHHFYLPSIGIYIILAVILTKLYSKNKRYFLYPAAGIILVLSIFTIERNYQLDYPLKVWTMGVKKEPHHIGNWLNLGVEYKNEGNLKKAKGTFLKALTIFSKDVDWKTGIYVNLAGIYFSEKEYDKALKYLNHGLKLKPNIARVYQIYDNMAALYERKGDRRKGIMYLRKALSINSYSDKTYLALARLSIQENRLSKAENFIKKAMKINPYGFYSYFLSGEIYERKGKLKESEEMYKKSIELKDDWFYSHYALAKLYIKLKKLQFIKELEETIKLNPQFKPALRLARFIVRAQK